MPGSPGRGVICRQAPGGETGRSTLPSEPSQRNVKMADKPSKGLADIIAASTALSDIDGRAGLLFYRGYDIHQLAGTATFEEIAYLLQRGQPPTRGELASYDDEIATGRTLG